VDVAELSDVNLKSKLDASARQRTLQPSDVSFTVPEEDSSASAGSPTVVVPPGAEKSPFVLPSDNIPLMDPSDSSSESELDTLPSVPPHRVPARYLELDISLCVSG